MESVFSGQPLTKCRVFSVSLPSSFPIRVAWDPDLVAMVTHNVQIHALYYTMSVTTGETVM